jgi:hypothetical protein
MPRSDRRIRSRVDVHWPVRIHHPKLDCVLGEVINISMTNVLFTSTSRYEPGESVQLEIQIAPDVWVHCIARIRRSEPGSRRRTAYGAMILHFTGRNQEVLEDRLILLCRGTEAGYTPA